MAPRDRGRAGFSLIEVLAALALTAALVAVVIPLAIQLVARWSAGATDIDAADAWMQAQLRLADDLAQTVPISIADPAGLKIGFRADAASVTLVRPGIGSRSAFELDTVTLSIESASSGDTLYRSTIPYAESAFAGGSRNGNRTVVLAGPFRLQFEAVGVDGTVRASWRDEKTLPLRMDLVIRPSGALLPPAASFVLPIIARTPLADLQTGEPTHSAAHHD